MKKNMKKLLVIVMALMPSLSICTFAQTPGDGPESSDPVYIPVKEHPSPFPMPAPRMMANEPEDIPVIPAPLPGGPGPRIQSNGNDDIPIIPDPTTGGGIPRIMQNGEPESIPVTPSPSPNPHPTPMPRFRSIDQVPECYHYDGVVYIYADNTISFINASVTRYDDNQVWSNAGSGNTLSITASDASGEYYLELTLSSGQSYIGKYIIE